MSHFSPGHPSSSFVILFPAGEIGLLVWSPDCARHKCNSITPLEYLQRLITFRNLYFIDLDIQWKVGLTDDELLELASAWAI